jgi:hypothetical protein
MLWFSAHEAAGLGLWDTACNMLTILHSTCSMGSFALSETDIQYQVAFFKICAGHKDCVAVLDSIQRAQAGNQAQANNVLAEVRQLADLLRAAPAPTSKENSFLVSAAFKYKSSPIRMAEGVWGDHTFGIMK